MQVNAEMPSEIKRILVPIDYSNYSVFACRYAAKIARNTQAEITLFHAFYSPAYDLIDLTGNKHTKEKLRDEVTKNLSKTAQEEFNTFFKNILKYPEPKLLPESSFKYKLSPGLPKDQIFEFTDSYQPDLIIMGTRGKDKKNSSLFGSLTEIAIKKMKYPVLAIPEEYKFVGLNKIQKIVYLTDFNESDFDSIKKLMKFTKSLDLTIHCLHINAKANQWEKVRMDGLKDYFYKVYDKTVVNCEILPNESGLLDDLNKYILDNNINLISLTTRKRNLIEKLFKANLTKKLFYHTSTPLLVFHS